jgi:hypothetical protein
MKIQVLAWERLENVAVLKQDNGIPTPYDIWISYATLIYQTENTCTDSYSCEFLHFYPLQEWFKDDLQNNFLGSLRYGIQYWHHWKWSFWLADI